MCSVISQLRIFPRRNPYTHPIASPSYSPSIRPTFPGKEKIRRHMCVQLRSLSHAQVLKDYIIYIVPRLKFPKTPSLPNTLLLFFPWGEGAWRLGHIFFALVFLSVLCFSTIEYEFYFLLNPLYCDLHM